MPNIFRFLVPSIIFISFSTAVIAQFPPSEDESEEKDDAAGKKEKKGQSSSRNPSQSPRKDKSISQSPSFALPHAPFEPVVPLSNSFSNSYAVLPTVLSLLNSEKSEVSEPKHLANMDDAKEIKSASNSYHPIVAEISKVLRKVFHEQKCSECEKILEKEINKLIQRKKEQSKDYFSKLFHQNFSSLNLKPENKEDILSSLLATIQVGQKEELDHEDMLQLPEILGAVLCELDVGKNSLKECKLILNKLITQYQKDFAKTELESQQSVQKSSLVSLPVAESQANIQNLLSQNAVLKVNLNQPISINNEEELLSVVDAVEKIKGFRNVSIISITLDKTFKEGEEERVYRALLKLLNFSSLRELKRFRIQENKLGSEKAINILYMLKAARRLSEIVLSNCLIEERGMNYLVNQVLPWLSLDNPPLVLNVEGNLLKPESDPYFLRELVKLIQLKELTFSYLNISNNNFIDKELILFFKSIKQGDFYCLKYLNISGNQMNDEVMRAMHRLIQSEFLPQLKGKCPIHYLAPTIINNKIFFRQNNFL